MTVQPIPEGYHTVTPYLIVSGVPQLIDFLKQAFGAEEMVRMAQSDGAIGHAEVKIGASRVMMGEAGGEFKPMPTMLHLKLAYNNNHFSFSDILTLRVPTRHEICN